MLSFNSTVYLCKVADRGSNGSLVLVVRRGNQVGDRAL